MFDTGNRFKFRIADMADGQPCEQEFWATVREKDGSLLYLSNGMVLNTASPSFLYAQVAGDAVRQGQRSTD